MADNRPVSRKKNITEGGGNTARRGEGVGGGPAGRTGGMPGQNRPEMRASGSSGGSSMPRGSGGGRSPLIAIIVAVIALLFGGGGIGAYLSSGSQDDSVAETPVVEQQNEVQEETSSNAGSTPSSIVNSLLGAYGGGYSNTSAEWNDTPNTGKLDTSVATGTREKRTVIKGDGTDVTTILVYMCGTDLESKSAMASRDLQEMLGAKFGDNINLIIYTGGCTRWQNNMVSSQTNQIYQIANGQMKLLQDNLGSVSMTDPKTLSGFIQWGQKNFPANRYDLILWDHGGGSTSGYGYDEKFKSSGSMSLSGINTALKAGGVSFDFIGFDACLMATVETALMLDSYGDYLIASEETEPGVGWYYTDWLTAYGNDPSMDTLTLGKNIIDSYTEACAKACAGQKTTLSLVDLAELTATVPKELSDFAKETSEMIGNKEYQTVSAARGSSREFAASSKIDQIDLIDFAERIGTDEGKELAEALKGAVKYNRTSSNMTNAYGLSVYFPSKKISAVDSMVNTYADIGMDEDYTKCIQDFAALGVAGQVAAGGSSAASPVSSIFGSILGSGTSSNADTVSQLLSGFLSSDFSSIAGLSSSNTSFLGRSLDVESAAEYIAETHFDPSQLSWVNYNEGDPVIRIGDDQWELIENIDLNVFYDDGEGYIDLGMDNTYELDGKGNLMAPTDRTWLAINGQVVSYYRISTTGNQEDYSIMGRVPAELNGERVNLILVFDTDHEDGYVAGAVYNYTEGETETIAKNLTELTEGDTIDFLCDYYDYDQNYLDSYYLGEPLTVSGAMEDLTISNVNIGDGDVLAMYCITDLYAQRYWSEVYYE